MSKSPPNHATDDPPPDPAGKDPKWAAVKDWLAIALVIGSLLLFAFMTLSDTIFNFKCSPWEHITFQCNRFDAK